MRFLPRTFWFPLLLLSCLSSSIEGVPPSHIYNQREATTSMSSSYVVDDANPSTADARFSLLEAINHRGLQDTSFNHSSTSLRLRRDLLQDYDNGDFPWEWAWNQSDNSEGLREGLAVQVGINFHKVFSVNVQKSLVDLVVWFRMSWKDPRLGWDPTEYGNLTTTWFYIQDGSGEGGETSEIWSPDIELWNQELSLQDSLTDSAATVSSDGSVFWSRPGHLRAVCKFEGLDAFPFDSLSCRMEFGSWSKSGLYLRPVLLDDIGFSIGGSETAGESYAEFTLDDVSAERFIYPPFVTAPEEDWPVVFYDVTLARAWQPYARGYLLIQIMLNIIGFCCFWIPPHVGERMSLAITSIVAAVASELVIASNLPQAPEITWFAKFTLGSTMFSAVVIFESAFVIYFTYHVGTDLYPRWFKKMAHLLTGKIHWKETSEDSGSEDDLGPMNTSEEKTVGQKEASLGLPSSNVTHDVNNSSVASILKRPGVTTEETTASKRSITFQDDFQKVDDDNADDDRSLHSLEPSIDFGVPKPPADQRPARFTLNSQPTQFSQSTKRGFKAVMGRDADDFRNVKEMINNYRWQKIARSIDSFSRVFFPVAYAFFLLIAFTTGT